MADTTVGIIGAGQMGSGIAHVFALSGYRVLLNDVAQDRIEAGIATISGNLNRQLASGRIDESTRDAANNLDKLHHRNRIHEMHADKFFRSAGCRGKPGYGNRGGVGGNQRIG